jgi:hypothetical protein
MTMVQPNVGNALGTIAEVVQMVNAGDTTFNMPYGTARLIIEPGQSFMGQREIAAHFMGRWWTDNTDPKYRERAEDLRRIRTLYGCYEDDAMWNARKPNLVLYSASGEEIRTLLDDPEGHYAKPQGLILGSSLEAQLAVMQQQMAQIQNAIANKEGMPPQMDSSVAPPPPPPHTPPGTMTGVSGFPGAVPLAAPTPARFPQAPVPQAPARGGTGEFSEEYLRDLQSTMPADHGGDDIVGDEIGTRIPVDAREVEPEGVPVDSPPILKTGPGVSAVRSSQT